MRRWKPLGFGTPDVRDETVYVYGLAHPETGEVRYVGRSSNPWARVASHCAKSAARSVREWCADIVETTGRRPRLRVIYAVPAGADSDFWEYYFLKAMGTDWLLNKQAWRKPPPTNPTERLRHLGDPFYSSGSGDGAKYQAMCRGTEWLFCKESIALIAKAQAVSEITVCAYLSGEIDTHAFYRERTANRRAAMFAQPRTE